MENNKIVDMKGNPIVEPKEIVSPTQQPEVALFGVPRTVIEAITERTGITDPNLVLANAFRLYIDAINFEDDNYMMFAMPMKEEEGKYTVDLKSDTRKPFPYPVTDRFVPKKSQEDIKGKDGNINENGN